MRIIAEFLSPLLVGTKKLSSNYIEGADYIAGDVMRAAFARTILNNCKEFKNDIVEVEGQQKRNWVYFRNGNGCKNCDFLSVCKKFKDIKFSFFYPTGTDVLPLTAMKCKNNDGHGFVDVLTDEAKCKLCPEGNNRVEFISGLVRDNKIFKPYKKVFTRTAINSYTKTAKEGNLFSLIPIVATKRVNDSLECKFEGYIDGITKEELKLFENIRVGSYISSGFGMAKLSIGEEKEKDNKENVKMKIKRFNERYKNKKEDKTYFALKLVSDCKLDFEINDKYYSTEEYKNLWKDLLNIGSDYDIDVAYLETINYRGYDTSQNKEDKRERAIIHVLKGSVFVLKTNNDLDKIYDDFFKNPFFGLENNNGFGKYEVYCGGVR